jgi:hypothetical protein
MAKQKLDEDQKVALQRIASRILETIKKLDMVFTTEGQHTLPHKQFSGDFRHRPTELGQEYMIGESYVGARGQLIFTFEPVDSQEYKHMEVDQAKMDQVFPMLGPAYANAIGSSEEDFTKLILITEDNLKAEAQAEVKAEEEAKLASQQEYTQMANFGRF